MKTNEINKINKILIFLFMSIFIISLVNAASTITSQSIGVYKQNQPLDLIQSCNNDTSICDSCNLSTIKLPDSTTLLEDRSMQKRTDLATPYFNLTLNSTQTNILGEYLVNGICFSGVEVLNFVYTARINKTGEILSTSQGLVYVVFLGAAIFFFMLSLYGSIKLPWGHQRDEEGKVVTINDLKFVKMFLIAITYIMLMFIFGILYNLTDSFLFLTSPSFFFYWLFWIMLSFLYPIIVFIFLIVIFIFWDNVRKKALLTRGLDVD